jgi:MoxR-like ATPase
MQTELLYRGQGEPERRHSPPRYQGGEKGTDSPSGYYANHDLADAVNTAIFLRQPLLVMGEPGTGKTQLAHSIAWEFDLPLHKFNTKMNSAGLDLFYHYDSVLQFHDAVTLGKQYAPSKYVQYAALGRAILFSNPPERVSEFLPEKLQDSHREATQSVVLIDEIDKAPRDFPNDILAETEELKFAVRETDWDEIPSNPELPPIVVFTSNQERNLPEAFLRRCIFYYIPFPSEADLRDIVRRRLTGKHDAGIQKFLEIRQDDRLVKKPATAELISWLRVLERIGIGPSEVVEGSDRVRRTYSVLLKTKEDFERLTRMEVNAALKSS